MSAKTRLLSALLGVTLTSWLFVVVVPQVRAQKSSPTLSAPAPTNSNQAERIYEIKKLPKRAKKAKILKRSDPSYPDEARRRDVRGVVVLTVALMSRGEVGTIFVVRGLPYGLTEESIKAARKTKFRPAVLDGQPVSIWVTFEYTFTSY
ncbi:MAG: periplasmic protein TonB [Blastocatellia bacterium]|jgi:TonB family protein|nr:periplasmic protein TonB [Blastocatellia bacterium]